MIRLDVERLEELPDWLTSIAIDAARERAAEVERRILDGKSRIEVSSVGGGGSTVVYTLPGWWQPVRRFRIALARHRHRRLAA